MGLGGSSKRRRVRSVKIKSSQRPCRRLRFAVDDDDDSGGGDGGGGSDVASSGLVSRTHFGCTDALRSPIDLASPVAVLSFYLPTAFSFSLRLILPRGCRDTLSPSQYTSPTAEVPPIARNPSRKRWTRANRKHLTYLRPRSSSR